VEYTTMWNNVRMKFDNKEVDIKLLVCTIER
jgi:hypothetical protein